MTEKRMLVYRVTLYYEAFDAGCPPVAMRDHHGLFSTKEKAFQYIADWAKDRGYGVDINTLEVSGVKDAWTSDYRFFIEEEEVY